MTTETQNADDDAPIETTTYGAFNDATERVANEIKEVCDGTPDKIEIKSDGRVWVQYTDNETPFVTMSGGIDGDDLPVACTFEGVSIHNNQVTIMLNHRALE
jgi:hypothetical protein